MRVFTATVLSDVDTGSKNGQQIDASQIVSASFQIVFGDATAAGTFKLQMSNDIDNCKYLANQNGFAVTNWTDIPSQTATIASGASAVLTIANCSYGWLRAVYTRSGGGSTTMTVNMSALSV